MRAKMLPGCECATFIPDAERLGKVVAATFGYYQRGNLVLEELRQMAMDSAVTAEDQGCGSILLNVSSDIQSGDLLKRHNGAQGNIRVKQSNGSHLRLRREDLCKS